MEKKLRKIVVDGTSSPGVAPLVARCRVGRLLQLDDEGSLRANLHRPA